MYRVSDELLKALKTENARAVISFDLVQGEVDDVQNADIDELSIERASVSGNSLEIGSAHSFEMTLTLNEDDKFKGVRFEGAEARAKLYYDTSQGEQSVPLGTFTVDGSAKKSGKIELAALDRMVKLDRSADFSSIVFPITAEQLAKRACYLCGVDTSRLDFSGAPNASYSIGQAPGACTWRRVLMWCCEIMGVCSYIDAEGYIVAKWYEDTGASLTPADRFEHKIHENDVVVRGVSIIDADDVEHVAGENTGFTFTIEGNELITHDYDTVAQNLAAVLVGFRHRPFEADTLPLPHLFPLDMLTFVEADGTEHPICITATTFKLNDNAELTGAGESETTSGYADLDPLTERERAVIGTALKKEEAEILEKTGAIFEQKADALVRMNEVVANSLGLYMITHEEADGSTQTYFCDKPTLAGSSLIYVFNAGGFAWATSWGGSNASTVWNYGISRDGNAILNYLTVEKLTAEQIDVGSLIVSGNFATVTKDEEGNVIVSVKISTDGVEIISPDFELTTDGKMTAKNAVIEGEINATSGTIGGFTITQNSLTAESSAFITEITASGITISNEKNNEYDFYAGLELSSKRISVVSNGGGSYSGVIAEPSCEIIDYDSILYKQTATAQNISPTGGNVNINAATFGNAVGRVGGTYLFMKQVGTLWYFNGDTSKTVSLSTYGITVGSNVQAFQVVYSITNAGYNYNKTIVGGCISPPIPNGKLIIGSFAQEDPAHLVYNKLTTRGAFLQFDDNLNALLCYDSRIGGKWYRYDVYTKTKTALW